METYPAKVAQLSQLAAGVAVLNRIVQNEQAILTAVQADATPAENALVSANDPGALLRERVRTNFYNNFYIRIRQMNTLINHLQQPRAVRNQPAQLRALQAIINAWVN